MRNLLFLLLLPIFAWGQSICGTDEYNSNIDHRSPIQQIFPDSVDLTTPYIIPVVVHIIENDSSKDPMVITDSDVHYIIECLNRDFNLQNADTATLTDTLKNLPGNMKITFILADTTPEGKPTTGITRTKTHIQDFGYSGNPIKFDTLGGKNAWEPRSYFNIWVGSLWPGLLGYSQFPGGSLQTDGIVVEADIFREEPVNYPHYNKGRVTVHEIGHSLSLRHAWGNGWGCTDNLVSDIPTQNGPNYNCPDTTFSVCHGDTTRDVVKHYMDYCGDSCMVMFTKGQVYNARKSIQEYRMTLVQFQFPATIKEKINKDNIRIYPTITDRTITIEVPNITKDLTLKIYSLSGVLVKEVKLNNSKSSINIKEINNGLYFVSIYQGKNRITSKRLVVGPNKLIIQNADSRLLIIK